MHYIKEEDYYETIQNDIKKETISKAEISEKSKSLSIRRMKIKLILQSAYFVVLLLEFLIGFIIKIANNRDYLYVFNLFSTAYFFVSLVFFFIVFGSTIFLVVRNKNDKKYCSKIRKICLISFVSITLIFTTYVSLDLIFGFKIPSSDRPYKSYTYEDFKRNYFYDAVTGFTRSGVEGLYFPAPERNYFENNSPYSPSDF